MYTQQHINMDTLPAMATTQSR